MNPFDGGWLIPVSLLVALVLAAFALPPGGVEWLGWLRPAWVSMVLFYWVIAAPHRVSLIGVWLFGFGLDLVQATPLGVNGFLLALVTYVGWRFHERLRMVSVIQQAGVLLLLLLLGELLRGIALNLAYERPFAFLAFLSPLVSALLWPFVGILLDRVQQRVRVL